jgi:hypothetical protein
MISPEIASSAACTFAAGRSCDRRRLAAMWNSGASALQKLEELLAIIRARERFGGNRLAEEGA